jgi:predicted acylesterase/phospholipase RssA
LLHAGVLEGLEEIALPIQAMSTVSGGSIIGAFYAAGGRPEEFREAMINGQFNLLRELLHLHTLGYLIVASRLVGTDWKLVWFLKDFNRTHVQAHLLDRRFLRGLMHAESQDNGRPELMIGVTDIASGTLVGITPRGVVYQRIRNPLERIQFANQPVRFGTYDESVSEFKSTADGALPRTEKTAMLVAASGAFPGALKPYSPHAEAHGATNRPGKTGALFADGGIVDNHGIVLLYAAQRIVARHVATGQEANAHALARWNADFVLVSDGSAIAAGKRLRSDLDEISHTIDVVSLAVATREMLDAQSPAERRPPAILLTPRVLYPQDGKSVTDAEILPEGTWVPMLTAAPGCTCQLPPVSFV